MDEILFAEYGQPPLGPNNLTRDVDWPPIPTSESSTSSQPQAGILFEAEGGDGAASSAPSRSYHHDYLLAHPADHKGPRTYVTSAQQINARQDKDQKSVVGLFENTSGPGTEVRLVTCVSLA